MPIHLHIVNAAFMLSQQSGVVTTETIQPISLQYVLSGTSQKICHLCSREKTGNETNMYKCGECYEEVQGALDVSYK